MGKKLDKANASVKALTDKVQRFQAAAQCDVSRIEILSTTLAETKRLHEDMRLEAIELQRKSERLIENLKNELTQERADHAKTKNVLRHGTDADRLAEAERNSRYALCGLEQAEQQTKRHLQRALELERELVDMKRRYQTAPPGEEALEMIPTVSPTPKERKVLAFSLPGKVRVRAMPKITKRSRRKTA